MVVNLCETQRNQRGGMVVLRNASVKATDCTSFDDTARPPPVHVFYSSCLVPKILNFWGTLLGIIYRKRYPTMNTGSPSPFLTFDLHFSGS